MTESAHDRRSAPGEDGARAKARLRSEIRQRRRDRDPLRRAADDAARTASLTRWLGRLGPPDVVACYLSIGTEPDTTALLAWLWHRGTRVIVPTTGRRTEDDWCPRWAYVAPGDPLRLVDGLPEPMDPVPCHEDLTAADAIVAPALAATRQGDRLGQGAGWYDRALVARRTDAPVCVLLNTDEVLPELPVEAHDRPVHWLATPDGVWPTQALAALRPRAG